MGGVRNLFEIYTPDEFDDNTMRRVWRWLQVKARENQNTIWDYNYSDPTAPRFSILAECITETLDYPLKDYLLYDHDTT